MKIIGLTYYDGQENVVLKSDSSLLVNRKPLFVPDMTHDLQVLPCVVLRVSRLGRCIAPKFAQRYYDAIAPGWDFFAADRLREAKQAGRPWTTAIAFENSLAVGEWLPEINDDHNAANISWAVQRADAYIAQINCPQLLTQEQMDRTVARVSELLTIRQGDLIYVAAQQQPIQLQPEDILRCQQDEHEHLYCKIK